MKLPDILLLKFPDIDLINQVQIRDDGDGLYIFKWDDSLGPRPDQEVLDQWAVEVGPLLQEQQTREKRRSEYLPIGDQNDAIIKQIKALGVELLPEMQAVIDHHDGVKAKYPKPKGK